MSDPRSLTEDERDRVVARAMARVEALRCLEYEGSVPVRVIDRSTFVEDLANRTVSDRTRLFRNARARALFLVIGSTDALRLDRENRGAAVQAFYSISDDETVLIVESDGPVRIAEPTLAHRLGHALQAQWFGFEGFPRNTTDAHQAQLGLIEGDVTLVQRAYERQCRDGRWTDECILPGETGGFTPAHLGLYLVSFQPYSDGASFVETVHERGGWTAVNDLYDDVPPSAKVILYPGRDRTFEPRPPDPVDRSSSRWHPVERSDGPVWDQLGEPVLFTMFVYPGLAGRSEVVDPDELFNYGEDGRLDEMQPYDFSHELTEGGGR